MLLCVFLFGGGPGGFFRAKGGSPCARALVYSLLSMSLLSMSAGGLGTRFPLCLVMFLLVRLGVRDLLRWMRACPELREFGVEREVDGGDVLETSRPFLGLFGARLRERLRLFGACRVANAERGSELDDAGSFLLLLLLLLLARFSSKTLARK